MSLEPLEIPDPFHPAVVHYPIVLTLFGTLLALGALLTRRGKLPLWTFLLFLAAAVGAHYAVLTGNLPGATALPAGVRALLREHIEWSERARNFDLITAGVAALSLLAWRLGRIRRVLALVTFGLALFTSYGVLKSAENGRKLVYERGVGVNAAATPAAGMTLAAPAGPSPAR